jgi:teichuronic acid biosynthesis glycosyltransferase TuaG
LVDDRSDADTESQDWLEQLCKNENVIILRNTFPAGAGNARNTALEYIKSTHKSCYVFFCDAGDYWETNYLSKMCLAMKEFDTNIVASSFNMGWSNGKLKPIKRHGFRSYKDMLRDYSTNCNFTGLFVPDTKIFDFVRFGGEIRVNDQPFFFSAVKHFGNVYQLREVLGTYFVGDRSSLSGKKKLTALGKWKLLKDLDLSHPERIYYFSHYAIRGLLRYFF